MADKNPTLPCKWYLKDLSDNHSVVFPNQRLLSCSSAQLPLSSLDLGLAQSLILGLINLWEWDVCAKWCCHFSPHNGVACLTIASGRTNQVDLAIWQREAGNTMVGLDSPEADCVCVSFIKGCWWILWVLFYLSYFFLFSDMTSPVHVHFLHNQYQLSSCWHLLTWHLDILTPFFHLSSWHLDTFPVNTDVIAICHIHLVLLT